MPEEGDEGVAQVETVGAQQTRSVWKDRKDLAPENPTGADLARLVRRGFGLKNFEPPALPVGAARVLELANNSDANIRVVARAIEEDMLLSAQILRLMQTPLYNRGVEISSIEQAVARLGLSALRHVVAEASLNASVFNADDAYEKAMEQLRKHSAVTGQAAQLVSRALGLRHDLAFLAGLFHDVGLAAALLLVSEAYGDSPPPLDVVWKELIGLHERLNWHVSLYWKLPDGIREIVRYHHHIPAGARDPLGSSIVCLADHLAEECGIGNTPEELDGLLPEKSAGITSESELERVGKRLGLTAADYDALLEECDSIVAQVH